MKGQPGEDDEFFYLDCNATTPLDPRALEAMHPYLVRSYANASSHHVPGALAARAVESARDDVAELIAARPQEIIFTSSATESNNLALFGAVGERRGHIVSVATEHKSVLDPLRALADRGVALTLLTPDTEGWLESGRVTDAIVPETMLVSVMAANNELGTLAPLREIAAACRKAGVLFHCDAAQLVGKLPIDVRETDVDLLSMSAHKMYGPKGVGALYVRRGVGLEPMVLGGGHERGLRSGTLNVAGIVGFGTAAGLATQEMATDAEHCESLRVLLLERLRQVFPLLEVNGHSTRRLPGTLSVRLPGLDADSLQVAAPRVAASSGSACASATPEPSHVLRAIGRTWDEAQECIRFGVGRFTTEAEVLGAVNDLRDAANRLCGGRQLVVEQ